MLLYIIIFVLFFSLFFIISILCLFKLELLKYNLYLIIPSLCIGFWALYALIDCNFNPIMWDFYIFYNSGKKILKNPAKLYKDPGYLYMPSFALLFASSLSLFPLNIAYSIFFIINYILGVLSIREFNKILIFMNVKESIHRFLFLLIISNGYFIYRQFQTNQTKYIILVIFLFIIRRELQFNIYQLEKDLKYFLINYNLFIFALAVAPNFLFLLLIIIFLDIPRNELFKKENLKKYSIVFLVFIIQNFLFIIFPNLIFDFIDGFNRPSEFHDNVELLYLRGWLDISARNVRYLLISSIIILFLISLILSFNNKLQIEEKFGYYALAYLFIGVHGSSRKLPIVLLPLILILFVPYLNQDLKGIEFIKRNSILLIGLLSITLISFLSYYNVLYDMNPNYQESPLVILDNLKYIIVFTTMMISLIFLKYKEYKAQNFIIE